MNPGADLLSLQTPSVLQGLDELRKQFRGAGPQVNDVFLLRFLKARKGVVPDAAAAIQAHLAWAKTVKLEQMVSSPPFPELPAVKRCYPHGYHGVDRVGRPVYFERLGALNLTELMRVTSHEAMLKYFAREAELQIREKFPACSLQKGTLVHRSVTVLDLQGLTFSGVTNAQARKFITAVIQVQADNFPEVMGSTVIVNAPRIFSLAWSFVKPLLDPVTTAKIEIIGPDPPAVSKKLLEMIAPDNLPDFLGGTCKCSHVEGGCLFSNKGPWQDARIVEQLKSTPWYHLTQRMAEGKSGEDPAAELPATPPSAEAGQPCPASPDQQDVPAEHSPVRINGAATGEAVEPSTPEQAELTEHQQRVQDLVNKLNAQEKAHMQTLEQWMLEALRWERELTLRKIAKATPYYEAEQGMRLGQLRTQESAMRYQQLLSDHDDYVQAVEAQELKLTALKHVDKDHDAQELHLTACEKLSQLTDRVMETEARRDTALADYRRALDEFERCRATKEEINGLHWACTSSCSLELCRPYFQAKWRHEQRVLDECAVLDSLRAELAQVQKETGAQVVGMGETLQDYEIAGVELCGASGEDEYFSADEDDSGW
mmetsp:Transcript_33948/g.88442  ORF Transcript_33948/g.88442 Transcript_33948/m.88442 type:complete len:599 (-) Transcript_33948:106-1902(-)